MSEYKLLSFDPTPEMVEAAEDAYMPFGDMELALRMAILAAPAVQGEPVAWSGWGCQCPGKMPRLYGERRIAELNCDWENGDQLLHFTATPQPTEQQSAPDASGLVVTLKSIEEWVMRYADPKHPVATVARKALADYRKQVGEA